jgi:hypothetical protein
VVLLDGPGPTAVPLPPAFEAALRSMRLVSTRPEVQLEEVPAPQRLAAHAVALSADVVDLLTDDDLGSGRLVLLHEPGGHAAWDGDFRFVTYVRSSLELEIGNDPMLAQVGWSWLTDALDSRGLVHTAESGTVTRVVNESFGSMATDPPAAEVEIRASWTPLDVDFRGHVEAWAHLLCMAAGLPPVPDGVVTLPRPRPSR